MNENTITLEQKYALTDTWRSSKIQGVPITLNIRNESDVVKRDKYGSIVRTVINEDVSLPMFALPLNYSPSQKKLDQMGIKTEVQVTATIPMKWFINAELTDGTTKDFINNIRCTVALPTGTYKIDDMALQEPFGHIFLYLVLGLNKQ